MSCRKPSLGFVGFPYDRKPTGNKVWRSNVSRLIIDKFKARLTGNCYNHKESIHY